MLNEDSKENIQGRVVVANEDLMILGIGNSRETAVDNFAEVALPSPDGKFGWEVVERLEWDTDNFRRPKGSEGQGLRIYTIPAEHSAIEAEDLDKLLIENRETAEGDWRDRFDVMIFPEDERPDWL